MGDRTMGCSVVVCDDPAETDRQESNPLTLTLSPEDGGEGTRRRLDDDFSS